MEAGIKTQIQENGIVVLTKEAAAEMSESSLWNEDLRPLTQKEHSWGTKSFSYLWVGMCFCIPSYIMAGGFITLGMNWWQSLMTMFLGNVIILIPLLLNADAGCRFGIPYPAFARIWFGGRGSHIPTMIRGVVGAGWFGVNTWVGAIAIDGLFSAVFDVWRGVNHHTMILFFIFLTANVYIGSMGVESIRKLMKVTAPTVVVSTIILLIWAVSMGKGFGPVFAQRGTLTNTTDFLKVFFPCLTGVISFWSTVSLNIPDFSRYAVSHKAHVKGQMFALPLSMTAIAMVAICVTSVTVMLYGEAIWSLDALLLKFPKPIIFLGSLVIALVSLAVNIAANLVAPARAVENLHPRRLSFAAGAMVTGMLAILMQPWQILDSFGNLVYYFLNFLGALIGPLNGISLADHWIVRKRRIDLKGLYDPEGRYNYQHGFNRHAIVALAFGIFIPLAGYVVPPLSFLSANPFIFGLFISGAVYVRLMKNDASLISAEHYDKITEYR
ncbi:MAG: NCS1 family nucleobase:cation symporter-1 [Tannerellaceae bacterium]|jgi:NCS1 family nucleobase:cation symporter-1|nr:NCS1 family nucleobase:cation symporter-1 [Tannerellaceae bacterium]